MLGLVIFLFFLSLYFLLSLPFIYAEGMILYRTYLFLLIFSFYRRENVGMWIVILLPLSSATPMPDNFLLAFN